MSLIHPSDRTALCSDGYTNVATRYADASFFPSKSIKQQFNWKDSFIINQTNANMNLSRNPSVITLSSLIIPSVPIGPEAPEVHASLNTGGNKQILFIYILDYPPRPAKSILITLQHKDIFKRWNFHN